MKKFKSHVLAILAFAIVGLVFTSCEKDEHPVQTPTPQEIVDINNSAATDKALTEIEDFVVTSFDEKLKSLPPAKQTKASEVLKENASDCKSITLTAGSDRASGTITVNFTGDCSVNNHTVSGRVAISYNYDSVSDKFNVAYMLEDYYYDKTKIEGTGSIEVDFSNEQGNRVHSHNFGISFTLPNQVKAKRSGKLVKEFLSDLNNDVVEVTGDWKDTFELNSVIFISRTHNINSDNPLRYKISCLYFVSGSVTINHTNSIKDVTYSGTLDFGQGECDRKSILTLTNGSVFTIQN